MGAGGDGGGCFRDGGGRDEASFSSAERAPRLRRGSRVGGTRWRRVAADRRSGGVLGRRPRHGPGRVGVENARCARWGGRARVRGRRVLWRRGGREGQGPREEKGKKHSCKKRCRKHSCVAKIDVGRQKGLLRPEVGRISRDIRGADARAPRRVSAGAARRRRRRRTRRRSCRSCRRTPLREAGREVSARRARALARVFSESASRDPRGRRRRASPRTHRARRRRSSTRRPPRRIARDGRPSRASSRRRERSSRGVRARAARATRFCFRASRSRERLGGGKGGGVMCGDAHAGVGDRAARPSRVLRYRGAKRRERGRARVHRAARGVLARGVPRRQ